MIAARLEIQSQTDEVRIDHDTGRRIRQTHQLVDDGQRNESTVCRLIEW